MQRGFAGPDTATPGSRSLVWLQGTPGMGRWPGPPSGPALWPRPSQGKGGQPWGSGVHGAAASDSVLGTRDPQLPLAPCPLKDSDDRGRRSRSTSPGQASGWEPARMRTQPPRASPSPGSRVAGPLLPEPPSKRTPAFPLCACAHVYVGFTTTRAFARVCTCVCACPWACAGLSVWQGE